MLVCMKDVLAPTLLAALLYLGCRIGFWGVLSTVAVYCTVRIAFSV
jgi:hypothetical protein